MTTPMLLAAVPGHVVLAAVRAHPGATVADLARVLGVHHSTATYHVERLRARGALATLRHRGRVHCFAAGAAPAAERARVVGQRSPVATTLLERLARAPEPVRLGVLAEGLPVGKAVAYWHLVRLIELGLVVAEGPPKGRRYRLAAPAIGSLVPPASGRSLAAASG
jgi:DNA-binding IclR family transcriptional regulator